MLSATSANNADEYSHTVGHALIRRCAGNELGEGTCMSQYQYMTYVRTFVSTYIHTYVCTQLQTNPRKLNRFPVRQHNCGNTHMQCKLVKSTHQLSAFLVELINHLAPFVTPVPYLITGYRGLRQLTRQVLLPQLQLCLH